ncbi:MAG: hypothetical protein ACM31C_33655 [Acidobacteriota bacterium]
MWRGVLVLVAACWTGDPPPPAQPAPQPAPRWHKHVERSRARSYPELEDELRAHGRAVLPTFVSGPVVFLDLDTTVITTLCGAVASQAAADWGARFADRARTEPRCRRWGPQFICSQLASNHELVAVELDDPAQPRIRLAVAGSVPPGQLLRQLVEQAEAQVRTATCP